MDKFQNKHFQLPEICWSKLHGFVQCVTKNMWLMKYICWALGVTVAIWNQERLWKSYVWKWFRIFEPTLTSCVQILTIRTDYSINVKGKLNNWKVNYLFQIKYTLDFSFTIDSFIPRKTKTCTKYTISIVTTFNWASTSRFYARN